MTEIAPQYPATSWHIVVEVYEADGTTLISEIPRRFPVRCQEPLNVPGTGDLSVPLTDGIFTLHPGILDMGNWVKFRMFDTTGANKIISAFKIKARTTVRVAEGEYGAQLRTVAGPTPHFLLEDFNVRHETQPPLAIAGKERGFDWTAKTDSYFYQSGEWDDTYLSAIYTSPMTDEREKKPKKFPDKTAYWIWEEDFGWEFWRYHWTEADAVHINISIASDEFYRVYVDNELLIERQQFETGFKRHQQKRIVIPAGDHVIAIQARAINSGVIGDGTDATIFAVHYVQNDGDLGALQFHSGPSNMKLHAGMPPPGWNKAEILKTVVEEAQDRGNDSALILDIDFTQFNDSATPEVAWDPDDELSRRVNVGTTALDLQAQLSETGDFDVWVSPTTFKLQAFNFRGEDLTGSIAFEPGVNLLNWTVDEQDNIKNDLLVEYDGGWTTKARGPSVTAHGSREGVVSFGNITNENTAEKAADRLLRMKGGIDEKTGTSDEFEVHIDRKPTGGLIPVVGLTPFFDFNVGDLVMAPNAAGTLIQQRLLALSLVEDAEGNLTFDPDLTPWS